MKPAPAPPVPGNTEQERMDYAVRAMFRVSKKDVLKEEAKQKRARARKRRAKSNGARESR
jgi:hypothetical protein